MASNGQRSQRSRFFWVVVPLLLLLAFLVFVDTVTEEDSIPEPALEEEDITQDGLSVVPTLEMTASTLGPTTMPTTLQPSTHAPSTLRPSTNTMRPSANMTKTNRPSAATTKTPTAGQTTLQPTPATPSPTYAACISNMSVHVMALDEMWGQTCNVLHMLVSATRLSKKLFNSSAVAFGSLDSSFLEASGIDLLSFTAHNVSLLLHCAGTKKNPSCVTCKRWLLNGSEMNRLPGEVPVRIEHPWSLFRGRAAIVGYLEELTWLRLPLKEEKLVDALVEKIRKEHVPKGWPLVGVHRRSMDGLCFRWLVHDTNQRNRGIMECHTQSKAVQQAPYYAVDPSKVNATFKAGGACYKIPNLAHRQQLWQRQCYLDAAPGFHLCELMFSQPQLRAFRNMSSTFMRDDNFTVLLATDKQMGYGDWEMFQNHNQTFMLENFYNTTGMNRRSLLLWEMWALAQTDYFVTQPLSSCETITVHWRYKLFNKPTDSVFPPDCWEKYNVGTNTTFDFSRDSSNGH